MNFAAILASKLAAPIAIAVAILSLFGNATLGFLYWSETRTTHTLTASNERLAGDLRTCQANGKTLEGALIASNAATDGLAKDMELAATKAKLAQAERELVAAKHDQAAAALNALPPLPAGADHCAAASKLIHDTLAGEHGQ